MHSPGAFVFQPYGQCPSMNLQVERLPPVASNKFDLTAQTRIAWSRGLKKGWKQETVT